MAVLSLRFQSKLLGFSTAVRILIPTEWGKEFDYKVYYENKEKLPVLWKIAFTMNFVSASASKLIPIPIAQISEL